jgi:hypothetical protein
MLSDGFCGGLNQIIFRAGAPEKIPPRRNRMDNLPSPFNLLPETFPRLNFRAEPPPPF